MRRGLALLASVAGALAAAAMPVAARAYRTTQDSASAVGITGPVAWVDSPVPYELNEAGSDDLAFDVLQAAVRRGFEHWTMPGCSGLVLSYNGTTARSAVRRDENATVAWVERGWSDLGYPAGAIGVTTPQYGSRDGRVWFITEADMEMNGVNFRWVENGGSPGSVMVDVESIVTHEAGHWYGVLHPCEARGQDGAPDCLTDDTWNDTTMFPAYTGEAQRSLEQDDIDAICFLYPGGTGGCEQTGCPAGQTCGADGVCTAVSDCRTTGCPAGQTCGADGRCAGGTGCEATGCPPGQSCIDGACRVTPTGTLGDYCASNSACSSGLCTSGSDTYCTQFCSMAQPCPDGFRCTSLGANSVCEPTEGRLGDPCETNGDCLSGQCASSSDGNFCTRMCGGGVACPDGFGCVAASGVRICKVSEDGCGCSVPGGLGHAGIGASLAAFGLLATLLIRRRRRARR